MKVSFHSSSRSDITKLFRQQLEKSNHFDWAVAFATHSMFKELSGDFDDFFRNGGVSRAAFEISQGLTEPDLIEELITLPGASECKLFARDSSTRGLFHHKAYLFSGLKHEGLMCGSLNFTKSAFSKNHESILQCQSSSKTNFSKQLSAWFVEDVWNSPEAISPEADDNILKQYRVFYTKSSKGHSSAAFSAKKEFNGLLSEISKARSGFGGLTPEISYLLGIIAASSKKLKYQDFSKRIICLRFQSNVLNSKSSNNSGYICAVVDGTLLGGIRLKQRDTQINQMDKIFAELEAITKADDLKNTISRVDKSKISTIVEIVMEFSVNSNIWNLLNECVGEFDWSGGRVEPRIPTRILNAQSQFIKRSFIQGYFDFRGRTSTGDRAGTHGKLRVGIQINTKAMEFGSQLKNLLESEFSISNVGLVDGSTRSRDNLLRFIPTKSSLKLFRKGWKRTLVREFMQYNDAM